MALGVAAKNQTDTKQQLSSEDNLQSSSSNVEHEESSKSGPTETASTIRHGEDAFDTVMPLCDVACVISTPTGKFLKCRTKYIGLHSKSILLLEMPTVSPQEKLVYMRQGYPLQACVISPKGEGARVYFKTKIEYVLSGGDTDILLVTLPASTQVVVGLRESVRLEINLNGVLDPEDKKYPCQIRDISQQGCLIVVDRDKANYRIGSLVHLSMCSSNKDVPVIEETLKAVVKNVSKIGRYYKYGVKFEDESLEGVSSLIEGLNFCALQQKFML
ncbi:PilZ domain-containing protein [Vibrio sp. Of14-4]|uniref:PilZ domain-containing protein n=1 Tax=Vibrio sp. Of14-4 TaxID=2724878 RepID=UPI001EF27DE4|nr:PilZ domain-containing protein [Vibrio sp. Of14-4]MCG7490410.1 PilZ domain-containing protein [Vibrio sp. Of14-4]